jgi:DNA-binding MarR family transcriptional regulator
MKPRQTASDARYQALLQLLRTADTLWNTSRVLFARWDLSPSQFNILNVLDDEPDGLSQIELGRQLIMHRSNVTGLVDRLQKRRLVERRDLAGDRRAYRIVLTTAGRGVLKEILPEYYRLADAVWGGFPVSRAREWIGALEKLSRNARDMVAVEKNS